MKSFFNLLHHTNEQEGITTEAFFPELSYEEIQDYLEEDYDLYEIDPETGDNILTTVAKYGDISTLNNFFYTVRNEQENADFSKWINNINEAKFYLHRNRNNQDVFYIVQEKKMDAGALPFSSEEFYYRLFDLLLEAMEKQNLDDVREILKLEPPLFDTYLDDSENLCYITAYDIALSNNMPRDILQEIINNSVALLLMDRSLDKAEKYSSIEKYLNCGANPNHIYHGIPILNIAIDNHDDQTVHALLYYNADPFLCDNAGLDALHLANLRRDTQNPTASYNIFNLVISAQSTHSHFSYEPSDSIQKIIKEDPGTLYWISKNNLKLLTSIPEVRTMTHTPQVLENAFENSLDKKDEVLEESKLKPEPLRAASKQESSSLPTTTFSTSSVSAFSAPQKQIKSL